MENTDNIISISDETAEKMMRWLKNKHIRKSLSGAKIAIVFDFSSGIGRSTVLKLQKADGSIIEKDFTDYSTW